MPRRRRLRPLLRDDGGGGERKSVQNNRPHKVGQTTERRFELQPSGPLGGASVTPSVSRVMTAFDVRVLVLFYYCLQRGAPLKKSIVSRDMCVCHMSHHTSSIIACM